MSRSALVCGLGGVVAGGLLVAAMGLGPLDPPAGPVGPTAIRPVIESVHVNSLLPAESTTLFAPGETVRLHRLHLSSGQLRLTDADGVVLGTYLAGFVPGPQVNRPTGTFWSIGGEAYAFDGLEIEGPLSVENLGNNQLHEGSFTLLFERVD